MKNIFKFLVLTASLSVALSMKDYCEMEKRLCGDEKHIGCEKHEFHKWESKLGTFTTEMKEIFLDQLNSFRRLVATGQQATLKSASNMRLVTWNNEMEYLASRSIDTYTHSGDCCNTDEHPNNSYLYHVHSENQPTAFITLVVGLVVNQAVKGRTEEQLNYSRLYSANLTSIGCAFGTFKNKSGRKAKIECVLNVPEATSLGNAYLHGEACSNCSPNTQICSDRYPGLCEDVKVLPLGPKGEPGLTGLNGTNGVNGKPGVDGKYGEKGDQGPRGPAGNKGDTGTGIKGDRGVDGPLGPVGPAGLQGLPGVSVLIGVQGPKGDAGLPGLPGLNGLVGAPGTPGTPGKNNFSEKSAFFWFMLGASSGMKSNGQIPWTYSSSE